VSEYACESVTVCRLVCLCSDLESVRACMSACTRLGSYASKIVCISIAQSTPTSWSLRTHVRACMFVCPRGPHLASDAAQYSHTATPSDKVHAHALSLARKLTDAHINKYTNTQIHTNIHTCTRIHTEINARLRKQTHAHVRARGLLSACVHVCACVVCTRVEVGGVRVCGCILPCRCTEDRAGTRAKVCFWHRKA